MSFGDPFGALWSGFGPDSIRHMPDGRADIFFITEEKIRKSWKQKLFDFVRFLGVFAGAALVLTVVLVIPILFGEVAMIDTIGLRGEELTAAEYASRLKNLILGTFIVAVSLVSFIASAMIASPRVGVRNMACNSSSKDLPDRPDPVLTARIKVQHV